MSVDTSSVMNLYLFCLRKVYVFIFLYISVILVLPDVNASIASYVPKDFIVNSRSRRENHCGKNSFQCRDESCISIFLICDGTKNCRDGTDESLSVCINNPCPKNTFHCAYGGCIDGDKKCDGRQDCADNSDELLQECPGFRWLNSGVTNSCQRNEFQCRMGDCINKDELCDGKKDCLDGSDETVTHCNAPQFTCPRGSFRCAYGACVDSSAKCNGILDCADGSDEDRYICNRTCTAIHKPASERPMPAAENQPPSITHDCKLPEFSLGTTYEQLGKNIIKVVCDSNYDLRIEGSPFIACYNRQWSPQQSCLPQCQPLKSITATYNCKYNDKEVDCNLPVKPGTESRAECTTGYYNSERFPRVKNTCLENGKWQHPQYMCNEDCGNIYDPQAVKPQVAYGATTTIGKFPWNAGIYHMTSGVFNHICGGTLISSYIVLTAAHCVTDTFGSLTPRTDLRIAVGKYNRDWEIETSATQKRDISGLFIPHNFQGVFSNFKYDIALIELNIAVILSTVVMPICIPLPNQNIYNRQYGYIAGWGQDETNTASEVLKSAILPYVDRDECIKLVPKSKEKVTEDKFCASITNGTNATNVMQGDSGAGFVFEKNGKYYIHGIVSTKLDNIIPTFTDISNEQNKHFLVTTHQDIEKRHKTVITQ